MSSSSDPDKQKPVVKDKDPHNYRKVGYSMIVISVSLVAIGLLTWAIGDNYHFSTNIMALQEVDAMTPKAGYNVVLFDVSQPVGSKIKLLDHVGTLDEAYKLREQEATQNTGNTIQVLVFNGTSDYNLRLMTDAEVYIQTPASGYNVVLYNYPLPVGQQLTLGIHEVLYENATNYQASQEDNLKGQPIQVLIFTSNFRDNLKQITNSTTPVGEYVELAKIKNGTTVVATPSQNQSAQDNQTVTNSSSIELQQANQTSQNGTATSNMTGVVMPVQPAEANANMTESSQTNMNTTTSATTGPSQNSSKTYVENARLNATVTTQASKSISVNETVGMNASGK